MTEQYTTNPISGVLAPTWAQSRSGAPMYWTLEALADQRRFYDGDRRRGLEVTRAEAPEVPSAFVGTTEMQWRRP